MKYFYLIIVLFVFISSAQAKYEEWTFIPSEVLTGQYVMDIEVDQESGNVYVLTIYGNFTAFDYAIDVFDGEKWEHLTLASFGYPYDSKMEISDIAIDPQGRLWAGTKKDPVYMENDEWKTLEFPKWEKTIRECKGVWPDSKGNVYFYTELQKFKGTYEDAKIFSVIAYELWRYDDESLEKMIYRDSTGGDPKFMWAFTGEMMPSDDLWLVVNRYKDTTTDTKKGGLVRINESGYEFHDMPTMFGNGDFYVPGDIHFDYEGNTWLLYEYVQLTGGSGYNFTDSQLGYYVGDEWTFLSEANGFDKEYRRYIENLLIDKNDVFWFGHSNKGLLRYEKNIIEVVPLAKIANSSDDGLHTILCNELGFDDQLWFGTARGIFVYNPDYLGIRKNETPGRTSSVYPNPVSPGEEITIEHTSELADRNTEITIFSISGKKVRQLRVKNPSEIVIQTEGLSAGVYNILLRSGEHREILKLTIN